ncbi:MAG: shikimate dehydrogenase [Alphaproteobacteria bacterium]|nr:shikimate dehydrogenase [Alphaproteobacteria bacterium]
MITGRTRLIAHLGYPTDTFTAPLIYNPWFASRGIDAVVVPMGVKAEDYPVFLRSLFRLSNIHGALVTMPHKVTTVGLLDEVSTVVRIAGSCNAILRRPDGSLFGDMFDGEGFARGAKRSGFNFAGARCLVVGTGGVGAAIAAAIAPERPQLLALCDLRDDATEALAARLRHHFPELVVALRKNDPAGYDLVVNATPLGMKPADPLPFDPARLDPGAFVGEVVLTGMTPIVTAAAARGCRYLLGTDMLFEQIPAYLEFFGYGTATPQELRAVATIPSI